jgi:hypothetical protein
VLQVPRAYDRVLQVLTMFAPLLFPLFLLVARTRIFLPDVWPPICLVVSFSREQEQHQQHQTTNNNINLAIAVAFERLLVIEGMSSSPNNPSLPTVTFVPYNPETINRNGRMSTVAARINHKNKSIPTNALTCVQVKAIEASIICCVVIVEALHMKK